MTAPIDVERLRELRRHMDELATPLRDPECVREILAELLDALISHEEWRRETELNR